MAKRNKQQTMNGDGNVAVVTQPVPTLRAQVLASASFEDYWAAKLANQNSAQGRKAVYHAFRFSEELEERLYEAIKSGAVPDGYANDAHIVKYLAELGLNTLEGRG